MTQRVVSLVPLLLLATIVCGDYWSSNEDVVNHLDEPQDSLLREVSSTTPNPAHRDANATLSPIESFALNRERAIQQLLGKVLRALGPEFVARLPVAPTNATLTPLNSALRVGTGTCPERYRRCSSQTFYPSCEVPRNTDEQMWQQRFTLFFNISSEISSIRRNNVLNATLRLYKLRIALIEPTTFIVKLHVFTKSLKRNRERSRVVASTQLSSDYEGWVFLNVSSFVQRLKNRNNHGFKISIQNEKNVPWNIPNFFVKMDCKASNESLIPLPFEVQLDDNTQRYPALNIRSGTQEVETDNDYLNAADNFSGNLPPHQDMHLGQDEEMGNHQAIGNSFSQSHIGRIQLEGQQKLDRMLNPHLYSSVEHHQRDGNRMIIGDSQDYDTISHSENESLPDDSDLSYGYHDSAGAGETEHDIYSDPQLRYKKQAPLFPAHRHENDQQYDMQGEHQQDSQYHYDDGVYDIYDDPFHSEVDASSGISMNRNLTISNDNSTSEGNTSNSLYLRRENDYSNERKAPHFEEDSDAAQHHLLDSAEHHRSFPRSENHFGTRNFNHSYRRSNRRHHHHHQPHHSHPHRHHPRAYASTHRRHRPHTQNQSDHLVEEALPQIPITDEMVVTTVLPQ
ncbi:uncharacterized protein LOC108682759 [Hyalella azteca]|uniref:Uncharacterized protein LOC108682759 n=1 Tax=Hyalella azteca TaxID=294128 RepID=A0A8B7PNC2_HYAAZ|nr:uncharacterized protein LOC108682759 [Hyalella azteca]